MSTNDKNEQKTPVRRGFAAMDPAKVKAISSKGGKAAHAAGTAHQFTSAEAKKAGRKGGKAPHVSRGRSLGEPHVVSPPATDAEIAASDNAVIRTRHVPASEITPERGLNAVAYITPPSGATLTAGE